VSGRGTAPGEARAVAANASSAQRTDPRTVQTLHEAVEAARRFGLVRENY
jgi:hypothetical protein